MPFKIQRVPQFLQTLLSTSGGETPRELEDRVRGAVDLLQFYGQTQLQQTFTFNAALAEAGTVDLNLGTRAVVLFAAWATVTKTATMTACRATVELVRGSSTHQCFAEELGPFGATETGNAAFGGSLPYPYVCPAGSIVRSRLSILGTDATAVVSVFAEFGVLG